MRQLDFFTPIAPTHTPNHARGATTRIALLSSPLRSRFGGGVFRLEFYSNEEIEEIIKRSAKILGVDVEKAASEEIARRSRFTPRTANFLLKRARDFAQVTKGKLSKETVDKSLALLGIDELGLGQADRALLTALIEKFGGGPVGLNTLAAALSEEQATIEEVHEPYLLQLGLLERTPRGRTASVKAFEHLKIKNKSKSQEKLL
jgi:Holliday junction DNA helicase RuvB